MKPTEIACRHCAAQPGESCFDGWVFDNQVQAEVKNYVPFHLERVFDAGTWISAAVPVSKEDIDKAAEGLV